MALRLGQLYKSLKRMEDAEKILSEAHQSYPENHQICIELGIIFYKQQRFEDAEKLFRMAIELNPKNYLGFIHLGMLLQNQGKIIQAKECFQAAMKLDPSLYVQYIATAAKYLRVHNFSEAEECLKISINLNSNHPEIYIRLAAIFEKQEKNLEAVHVLQSAVKLFPQNSEIHHQLGMHLNELEDWMQAEKCLRTALALKTDASNKGLINRRLARSLLQQGKFDEAIELLNEALSLNPTDIYVHRSFGRLYAMKGDYQKAEQAFNLVIKNVFDEFALNWRGEMYLSQEKYFEAEKDFIEALRFKPNFAKASLALNKIHSLIAYLPDQRQFVYFSQLGLYFLKKMNFIEAEPALRKAIQLNPEFYHGHMGLGACLTQQDKSDEAEPLLRLALEYLSQDASVLFWLGSALVDLKKFDEAEIMLTEALRLGAPRELMQANYRQLGIAQLEQKKLEAAYRSLSAAFQLNMPDTATLIASGRLNIYKGDYDSAKNTFLMLLANPSNALAHCGLGELYFVQNKFEEAEKELMLALELKPTLNQAKELLGKIKLKSEICEDLPD